MEVGEWIEVPIFVSTKGGGKKRTGTRKGLVKYIGPNFITVWNGQFNETFTPKEIETKHKEVVD